MPDRMFHVAVVDDEESIRRALLRLLRSASYDAEAFDSAIGFLRSLGKRTPDCVILDLHMPQMTGLELQQRLHVLARRPAVIVITAHDEPGTRERCLELGAADYFLKPVDCRALLASLARAVRRDGPKLP